MITKDELRREAILFAADQVESALESASDDDYIMQAHTCLKTLYEMLNLKRL